MRCKNCHYSLANLTEHRCPECGQAFDPEDPQTFDVPQPRRWRSALACAAISLLAGLAFLAPGIFDGGAPVRARIVSAAILLVFCWPFMFLGLLLMCRLWQINIEPWLIWRRCRKPDE